MKAKWCFISLIAILTLFGVCHEQNSAPNQEIVVQFANQEISPDDVQTAIITLKQQLQAIGVDNIQVRASEDGKLKISYYSEADVSSIERILSEEKILELGYTASNQGNKEPALPSDKTANSYNINIYEIQNIADSDWDFEGIYVLEIKSESLRFTHPNVYLTVLEEDDTERRFKIGYKLYKTIATAIDNTSNGIPEVRAGPSSIGNS